MQKSFVLFLFLIFYCCFSTWAQGNEKVYSSIDIVRNLTTKLKDPKIATDVILSQDFTLSTQLDDDYLDYILASIDEVRLNIQAKNLQQLRYVSFRDMSRKETGDIDLEDIDPDQVVFVQHNKRIVFAAVVDGGKITSITLVSKGNNRAHFVRY